MDFLAITTIRDSRPSQQRTGPCPFRHLESRTVGCFETMNAALEVVHKNLGDLNEAGWYPWLVIEKMPFGLYPIVKKSFWFHWDNEQWKAISEMPDELKKSLMSSISISHIG